ncbi:hypothetical protein GCM10020331_083830 [Ectobacillus funiculus]
MAEPVVGKGVLDVIPDSGLTTVMQTGIPQYNEDRIVGNARILVSILPIRVKGKNCRSGSNVSR